MSQIVDEKVRQVTATYQREAQAAEDRARRVQEAKRQPPAQQQAADDSKAWCDWIDRRIGEHFCAFDLLELDDEEVQGALLPHTMHGVQSASR
jgi:hypothetical protein